MEKRRVAIAMAQRHLDEARRRWKETKVDEFEGPIDYAARKAFVEREMAKVKLKSMAYAS